MRGSDPPHQGKGELLSGFEVLRQLAQKLLLNSVQFTYAHGWDKDYGY